MAVFRAWLRRTHPGACYRSGCHHRGCWMKTVRSRRTCAACWVGIGVQRGCRGCTCGCLCDCGTGGAGRGAWHSGIRLQRTAQQRAACQERCVPPAVAAAGIARASCLTHWPVPWLGPAGGGQGAGGGRQQGIVHLTLLVTSAECRTGSHCVRSQLQWPIARLQWVYAVLEQDSLVRGPCVQAPFGLLCPYCGFRRLNCFLVGTAWSEVQCGRFPTPLRPARPCCAQLALL